MHGAGGFVDLKLGHYNKDGIEVVDVEGEIDVYTAPRLRELLIDLVNKNNYQLVVNMEKVEFLDSTGLGVLVGGLKRVRAHDGSLDLVCTQERILKIFRIRSCVQTRASEPSCARTRFRPPTSTPSPVESRNSTFSMFTTSW